MSRSIKKTLPAALANGVVATILSVPVGHKYELLGLNITGWPLAPTDIGLWHLGLGGNPVVTRFHHNSNVNDSVGYVLDCNSELFNPGEGVGAIAQFSALTQVRAWCWYVDVTTT